MTRCAAEGVSFLTLNHKAAWERGRSRRIRISERGLELATSLEYAQRLALEAALAPGGLTDPDLAVGRCNLLYILDRARPEVRIFDPSRSRSRPVRCLDAWLSRPSAVAYSPGTVYLANLASERRLLAFTEIDWQVRWFRGAGGDDAAAPLVPVDLAAGPDGDLFVLVALELTDDGQAPAGSRLAVLRLDPGGRTIARLDPPELALSGTVALAELPRRLALAVAGDGWVFVLEGPGRRVFAIPGGGGAAASFSVDRRASAAQPFEIEPAGLGIDAAGRLYLGDGRPALGRGEEDSRFIHRFSRAGDHLGEVRGYRGPVSALAVDAADRIILFDAQARRLVILTPEERLQGANGGPPSGLYYSRPLDSGQDGTRWHRLALEAEIPEHAQVLVSCVTLGRDEAGSYGQALAEDADLETFFARAAPLHSPRDALIEAPAGRYLAVRLELVAAESRAPTVRSFRAWFPRTSYLRYLPAVFQEDETAREFLERFLALFETLFSGLEDGIDEVVRAFDPRAVGGEFLAWLGSWLAISADEGWSEEQLRQFILEAPRHYRRRGTREGIETMVELFARVRPLIIEPHQLRCGRDPEVRETLARLYGDDPYCFCVLLDPYRVREEGGKRKLTRIDAEQGRMVRRIVETDKPAHTSAGVRVLQPWITLDFHTYLGRNTYLSKPAPQLDAGGAISRDSVLAEPEAAGQIERRSRVEVDTSLS